MKKKGAILLILLCLITKFGNAESEFRKGLIITKTNDTIYGYVKKRINSLNYKSCIFKKDSVTKEYFSNEIRGFGYINDKFFISGIHENLFVEQLIKGRLNLFKIHGIFYVKKEDGVHYKLDPEKEIKEVNGKMVLVEKYKWRGIISFLTSDLPFGTNQEIKNLRLNEKELTLFIEKYNTHFNSESVSYKKNKPWNKIQFGLGSGFVYSNLNISSSELLYFIEKYNSVNLTFAAKLKYSSPRISENFAIQTEIKFSKSFFHSLNIIENQSIEQFHDVYLEFTIISIPFLIQYNFTRKKYNLYFQAGLEFAYLSDNENKVLSEYNNNGIINTYPEREAFQFNNKILGPSGGFGIYKKLLKFNIGLDLRYSGFPKLENHGNVKSFYNQFALSIFIQTK